MASYTAMPLMYRLFLFEQKPDSHPSVKQNPVYGAIKHWAVYGGATDIVGRH